MASVVISPKMKFFIPATGNPASGYKVQTFAAGTSTPLATYTDAGLTTPAANPIVLDSSGEALIYAAAGTLYKIVFQDNTGATIWTADNVTIPSGSSTTTSEWVASGLTPTFISTTSFSVVGDQRSTFQVGSNSLPGIRLKSTNTAGTVYSTVTASSFGGGITTVTVANDSPGVLDSGLSVVQVGIQAPQNTSIPMGATSAVGVSFSSANTLTTGVAVILGATNSTPTVQFDTLNEFSTTTGKFTAKRSGFYLMTCHWATNINGVTFNGSCQITAQKNAGAASGATTNLLQPAGPVATNSGIATISVVYQLAPGDTIQFQATITFSAGTVTYGAGYLTFSRIA